MTDDEYDVLIVENWAARNPSELSMVFGDCNNTLHNKEWHRLIALARIGASVKPKTPVTGWDGIGTIFDPHCHCDKCEMAKQDQRDRDKKAGLSP